jgi:branched-chain amino acid transport system permease protein
MRARPVSRLEECLRWLWPLLSLVILVGLVVIAMSFLATSSVNRSLTEALVKLVAVIGLYIFIGNSGILSFGHVSFMAIGAYGAAWQTCCAMLKPLTMHGLPNFLLHTTVPVLPAALMAGALAALVALVFGAIIMRLAGIAASIATLALLFIVYDVYSNWQSVTLGKGSIVGLPTYITPFVAYGWVVAALSAAFLFQVSRYGLQLRAAREDEIGARALGINIYPMRLAAFVLGGFFAGVGGALYGHFLGVISIDSFFLDMTFMTLAMLVIGGMRSLAGSVVGVAILSIIIESLRAFENGVALGNTMISVPPGTQEIVLAIAMLAILIFRPQGIMGGRELPFPVRSDASADPPAVA